MKLSQPGAFTPVYAFEFSVRKLKTHACTPAYINKTIHARTSKQVFNKKLSLNTFIFDYSLLSALYLSKFELEYFNCSFCYYRLETCLQ